MTGRTVRAKAWLDEKLGGPARRRAVLILASVLALEGADMGAIGAIAPQLEHSLHVGDLDIGLLVTTSALAGAAGNLPFGWLTDRRTRTTLLSLSVIAWGVLEGISALAFSFLMLLLVRLVLGLLSATTGPPVASLTGDLFPVADRARLYGAMLTGELLGAGLGLLIAGEVVAFSNWHVALVVLALPSIPLAWALRRLPEPARGGQSQLARGATEIEPADQTADASPPIDSGEDGDEFDTSGSSIVVDQVRRQQIPAASSPVPQRDPRIMGPRASIAYVLHVRSNVMLIVASAFGYFYLAGLETFALIYLRSHFGLSQGMATAMVVIVGGAVVAGALSGGRIADYLVEHGHVDGRLLVAIAGFATATMLMVPALIVGSIVISLPLFMIAGFALAATNPGLDAARLDIMPSTIWGRAEAVRSALRGVLQAFAPLLFGSVSALIAGTNENVSSSFAASANAESTSAHSVGLEAAFLVMLVALAAAAGVIAWGRRAYPGDVVAAAESEERFPPQKRSDDNRAAPVPPRRRVAAGSTPGGASARWTPGGTAGLPSGRERLVTGKNRR